MSEENRRDWLAVAWGTLKNLPADLLSQGCAEARKTCDHPAKIVPTIVAATEGELERRRDIERMRNAPPVKHVALPPPPKPPLIDRRGQPMSAEETSELNVILERLGASARYREDGSRYFVKEAHRQPIDVAKPLMPSREDYLSWGVDPSVLDKIEAEKAA